MPALVSQQLDPIRLEELPDLMRPCELARFLRTTENALSQNRYLGRGVPYIREGRRVLYARADVIDYLQRQTVQPGDELRD